MKCSQCGKDVDKTEEKVMRLYGFKIRGKTITKKIGPDGSISELLSLLSAHKVKIKSIEIKEPSLEDYFIKMVKKDEVA